MVTQERLAGERMAALARGIVPSGGGGLAAPDPREGGTEIEGGGADFEEGGGWEVGEGLGCPKMEGGGVLYSSFWLGFGLGGFLERFGASDRHWTAPDLGEV